jgi:phosphoesterase RecJ-like protein
MAVLHMTLAEIAECGASRTDCDVLVNYAREIETVEIAGFINEMPDGKFKVSFRSKNYADVAAFAGEYGGGGHVRAAGCVFEGPIETIEATIVEKAKEYLK